SGQVHRPHGGDKSYRTPYPYGREYFYDVKTSFFQYDKGYGIVQCDGGHIKNGIEKHNGPQRLVIRHPGCPYQTRRTKKMTDTKQLLRTDIPVGQKTHQSGCEQRSNTHPPIDIPYLGAFEMKRYEHIPPHGDQP